MKWTLERGRLLLHVVYANNLVTIADLVKIGIKLIETCMFFCCYIALNNCIVIYVLVLAHLLIVIDCYMLQIWHLDGLMMQIR